MNPKEIANKEKTKVPRCSSTSEFCHPRLRNPEGQDKLLTKLLSYTYVLSCMPLGWGWRAGASGDRAKRFSLRSDSRGSSIDGASFVLSAIVRTNARRTTCARPINRRNETKRKRSATRIAIGLLRLRESRRFDVSSNITLPQPPAASFPATASACVPFHRQENFDWSTVLFKRDSLPSRSKKERNRDWPRLVQREAACATPKRIAIGKRARFRFIARAVRCPVCYHSARNIVLRCVAFVLIRTLDAVTSRRERENYARRFDLKKKKVGNDDDWKALALFSVRIWLKFSSEFTYGAKNLTKARTNFSNIKLIGKF